MWNVYYNTSRMQKQNDETSSLSRHAGCCEVLSQYQLLVILSTKLKLDELIAVQALALLFAQCYVSLLGQHIF